uniref:Uncharacterized protein n=1 Tax=viral metagenome TaxID=1070528 RepID=A0A6M3IZR2_9ZZZZ
MTNVYSPQSYRTCVAPGARTVVSAVVKIPTADLLVPIPFRGRLVHFQSSVTVAVGSAGDIVVGIEKDVADGTLLGELTIAGSATVGTEDTGVLTGGLTDETLTIDNQDVCLAVTGSASAGQANVFMIFEHSYVE